MRLPVIFHPLLRAWRRRGHGIHSPFAFRFVTTVLRQPCDYYAYTDINSSASSVAEARSARRIYRIILALQPAGLTLSGDLSASCHVAAHIAMGSLRPSSSSVDFPATSTLHICSPDSIPPLLDGESAVIIGSGRTLSGAAEALFAPLRHGMLFSGTAMAVIIGLSHLPKQKYLV